VFIRVHPWQKSVATFLCRTQIQVIDRSFACS
jgi:hypothetical protein